MSLLLPRSVDKPVVCSKMVGNGKSRVCITLSSRFAVLEIELCEHWSMVTEKVSRRTFSIATRSFNDPKKYSLLSVPVRLEFSIKPKALHGGALADATCAWFSFLYRELYNWLSFERYTENNTERLLVEILDRTDKVQQKQ